VDLTLAGLVPEVIQSAVEALVGSPDYDAVVCVVGSSGVGRPRLMADPVIAAAAKADKPIMVYTNPTAPAIVRRLNEAGVPAYESPEALAAALAALRARSNRASPVETGAPPTKSVRAEFTGRRGALNEAEAKRLFASAGVRSVRERVAATADEAAGIGADLGDTVTVKLLAHGVAHKTEVGGVRINVPAEEVGAACDGIAAAARHAGVTDFEGFLIQEMVAGGIELILGFARDPQLGPAVLLGAGGTLAELYDDTAIRLLPVARADVESMLDELKIAAVLNGHRGRPPGDVDALIAAVLDFAALCTALGDRLIDAEINPLFVLPPGEGVKAADGVAVFQS
jgi:acyl-CoA synthetase (NDP forming)